MTIEWETHFTFQMLERDQGATNNIPEMTETEDGDDSENPIQGQVFMTAADPLDINDLRHPINAAAGDQDQIQAQEPNMTEISGRD